MNQDGKKLVKKIEIMPKQKIGFLEIIKEIKPKNKKRYFAVKCVCGKVKEVRLSSLLNGKTKSCGCKRATSHGGSYTRLYRIWVSVRQRCRLKTSVNYKKYGAKGINVIDEWYFSFETFRSWALSNGYKDDLTIDRKDNSLGYSPDNCRWVSYLIQNTNQNIFCTNTSGYTGVSWSKARNKWVCVISINNKSKKIGEYDTKKESVDARNKFINENNLPHKKNVYTGE